jgi:hypothetical protein
MVQERNGDFLVQMLSFTLTYRLVSVPRFILNVLTAVTDFSFRAEILSLGPLSSFAPTEFSAFTGAASGTN